MDDTMIPYLFRGHIYVYRYEVSPPKFKSFYHPERRRVEIGKTVAISIRIYDPVTPSMIQRVRTWLCRTLYNRTTMDITPLLSKHHFRYIALASVADIPWDMLDAGHVQDHVQAVHKAIDTELGKVALTSKHNDKMHQGISQLHKSLTNHP